MAKKKRQTGVGGLCCTAARVAAQVAAVASYSSRQSNKNKYCTPHKGGALELPPNLATPPSAAMVQRCRVPCCVHWSQRQHASGAQRCVMRRRVVGLLHQVCEASVYTRNANVPISASGRRHLSSYFGRQTKSADVARDPARQASQLRQLNQSGQAEAVVGAFEGGRVAFTQENLGEYIKALARLDRLDNSRMLSLMQ
ncbi:AAA domain-containing protein, partial [Haematococcus lacustris]